MDSTHHSRPRPDDSPPSIRIIVGYSLLSVLILVGLKFGFDSYLDQSRIRVRGSHIAESHTVATLDEYREQQRSQLTGGAMPIDRAVQELGRRGRNAFPLVRPGDSYDLDPLRGWSQLPREVPALHPTPPPPPPPPAPSVPAEGFTFRAADGTETVYHTVAEMTPEALAAFQQQLAAPSAAAAEVAAPVEPPAAAPQDPAAPAVQ